MAKDNPPAPDPHGRDMAPSPWVARFAPLAPPGGAVLDVACGAGRHACYFLARGHKVVAIDREIGLLGALGEHPALTAIACDLEAGAPPPFAGRRFACVVVTNYLHRPLLPAIVAAVDSGGMLIYETFAAGNERFGRPNNPDFLLKPGELLDAVRGRLIVVAYEDIEVDRPRPAMVQRIAARAALTVG